MTDTRSRFLTALAVALAVLIAVEAAWLNATAAMGDHVSDFFVKRWARSQPADPDIVIVAIDEASITGLAEYAGRWPWPRALHGELIAGIAAQQPKAIVFDVMFGEPDVFRPDSDAAFNDAAKSLANVYFPTVRHAAAGDPYGASLEEIGPALGAVATSGADAKARVDVLRPMALAPENWRLGLINFTQDADGVGRRYLVDATVYGWRLPSLPARVGRDLGWPVPAQGDIRLAWRGGEQSHPTVSYAEVYADFNREHRTRPPDEFKDKVVLIGATATGLHDIRVTPVSTTHLGVEILATAFDNLKNGNWLRDAPRWLWPAVALALVLALAIAFARRANALLIGATLAAVTAGGFVATWLALRAGWQIEAARPLVFAWGFFAVAALHDFRDERRVRETAVREFGRFVNPHVVQELIAQGGLSRAGESRQVTLLFSDIRGFTTLSESRTPQEVVDLLNRYFSRQVDVIFRHGGTLDKFIGDAIMACWGAPVDDADHAVHAVAAALDMADTLAQFRVDLGAAETDFDVGIGLHSGAAVVGLIGAETRKEYTAIGDTVNLASRIEGLTKGVARILVSEDTRARCGDAFDFVDHGSFAVKGRAQEVRLYEPRRRTR
jgi:adenylate cyclase